MLWTEKASGANSGPPNAKFYCNKPNTILCQAKLLPMALLLRKLYQMWWNFQIFTVMELTKKNKFQKNSESSQTPNCNLECCRVSIIVFHKEQKTFKTGWRFGSQAEGVSCEQQCEPGQVPKQLWLWRHSTPFVRLKCNSEVQVEARKGVAQLSPTWSLWTSPVHEAKHVATGLTDSSHLSQDREVVNDKGHLVPLLLGKVLCVPQDPESCDVCGCMCIEGVHESSSYRRGTGEKNTKSENTELSGKCFNNIVHSLNQVVYL